MANAVTRILDRPGCFLPVRWHLRHGLKIGQQPSDVNLLTLDADELRLFRWRHMSVVFQSAMSTLNPVLRVQTQLTDMLARSGNEGGRRQEAR